MLIILGFDGYFSLKNGSFRRWTQVIKCVGCICFRGREAGFWAKGLINNMNAKNEFLKGKRGLIMGVANERSIAWGIAEAAAQAGAELAFTYQGDALEKRVRPLAEKVNSQIVVPCDVTDEPSVDKTFATIAEKWGGLDFVVHAIAFSDKNELDGLYLDTTRENFKRTMDISVYSFTAVAQRAAKLMNNGGSLVTLTYYGSERVMPHYNVMGVAKAALEASVRYLAADLGGRNIRVNAISAGPIKTLAASGIGDFRYILKWNELNSPLKRNVTIEDVGRAGLFLLSDLGSGVTGEVLHVDSGYHTVGMVAVDAAAQTAELLNSIAPKKSTEAA
jgi:enoyl-[acyl-carrier protein] reductase I